MKKRIKNLLAIVLAGAMVVASLSGCGGSDAQTSNSPSSGTEQGTAAPVVEKKDITVTAFTFPGPDHDIKSNSENKFFIKLAELTGVTIDFTHPIFGNESTEFDLMLASGEYADIIMESTNGYKGGHDAAIDDGVYRDLTDYVEKYMPNYYALIQSDPEVRRIATTENGRIVGLVAVEYNAQEKQVAAQPAFAGMAIRKDWLDECGLSVPVTYDDWTTTLRTFKEKYGCSQPLYMCPNGYWALTNFAAGYGAKNTMQLDGSKVTYGPATDAWKDYCKLLKSWYEEGLIGSEYLTNDVFGMDVATAGTGQTGAMFMVYSVKNVIDEMCGGNWVACQLPVVNEGEVAQAGANDGLIASARYYITTHLSEENLPQVLQMFDYMYSEEGALLGAYGIEGEACTMEDGKPVFTDLILNNPDGMTTAQAMDVYCCPAQHMVYKDWSREYVSTDEASLEMCNVWDKDGTAMHLPTLSLNEDEGKAYASAITDVESYVKEMTNRFIMGTSDIDAEWDTYINTLYEMNLQAAIDAEQSAYDRYMSN